MTLYYDKLSKQTVISRYWTQKHCKYE